MLARQKVAQDVSSAAIVLMLPELLLKSLISCQRAGWNHERHERHEGNEKFDTKSCGFSVDQATEAVSSAAFVLMLPELLLQSLASCQQRGWNHERHERHEKFDAKMCSSSVDAKSAFSLWIR